MTSGTIIREVSSSAVLPAAPDAAGHARRFLSGVVESGRWSEGELDVPALLLTELVSNAVRHASLPGDAIEVTVTSLDNYLHVAVRDQGPGFDRERVVPGDPGFGLPIVDELASRWGVDRSHDGTVAWFEILPSRPA
jgi:anti-sigma regulatory factor (Ser/Thr protein kinase)